LVYIPLPYTLFCLHVYALRLLHLLLVGCVTGYVVADVCYAVGCTRLVVYAVYTRYVVVHFVRFVAVTFIVTLRRCYVYFVVYTHGLRCTGSHCHTFGFVAALFPLQLLLIPGCPRYPGSRLPVTFDLHFRFVYLYICYALCLFVTVCLRYRYPVLFVVDRCCCYLHCC